MLNCQVSVRVKPPNIMVEKAIDQATLQSEVLELAVSKMYSDAVQQQKLRPVNRPEVDIKKFVPFTTVEFTVKVEVIGKVELPDYKSLKLAKPPAIVNDSDITAVLKNLQTGMAEKKDVDRAAQKTDQVWINFSGKDAKDKPVPGADGKDYPIVLGSNTFIPGFEDNVVAMKATDEKTLRLLFRKIMVPRIWPVKR